MEALQKQSLFTPATLRLVREQSKPIAMEPWVYNAVLNSLLAAKILFEANEALERTTAYRQELKAILKRLQPLLMHMLDEDYGALIEGDALARITYEVEEHFKTFLQVLDSKRFIRHSPSELAGLGLLINEFHQSPTTVLEHNGIKIGEEVK